MNQLSLSENSILVVPQALQTKTLKKLKAQHLFPSKIITLEELKSKYFFSYDEQATYYLMKKYNYQYDVANMYLSHLSEVSDQDYNQSKIKTIINLKHELDQEHLLYYHPSFQEYAHEKQFIFYQIEESDKRNNLLITALKQVATISFYQEDSPEYSSQSLYEFSTIEEEVDFIATKICELITSGYTYQNIKLCGLSSEYSSIIKRIFTWYHLPIQIEDNYLYSTKIGQDFLTNLTTTAKETLDQLAALYPLKDKEYLTIYNQLINILNKYTWAESLLEVKDFLIADLKKEKVGLTHYDQEITIINSLLEANDDDFIILMGFNQGAIPLTQKDESYFNDTLKQKLNLETTTEENQRNYRTWLKEIKQTKNLIITYKKTSSLGEHYLSSLNDDLNLTILKPTVNYNYSNLANQLKLAEKLDTFIKYNEKSPDLETLYYHYPTLPYNQYNSNYQTLSKQQLHSYLEHHLVLSYSAMNTYYQCGFRYYLANILKLNIYEETFYTVLGNLFHYLLSLAFNPNRPDFDLDYEYQHYLSQCSYPFNSRENFFLKQLKPELAYIISTIQKQYEFCSLKNTYLEERIMSTNKYGDVDVSFKGFVDKILTNDTHDVVAIIDYKTGNPDLNLNHTIYGLDLQLPIYIYLARQKFPHARIAGFYLQKILNNEISRDYKHSYTFLKEDKLKLQGYSNSDINILEQFDSSYNESKVIKGMRTTSKGVASKKILDDVQIDLLEQLTAQKITEAITNILEAKFPINPKKVGMTNVGCEYCPFQDICFKTDENLVSLKEYKKLDFLGGEQYDSSQTA